MQKLAVLLSLLLVVPLLAQDAPSPSYRDLTVREFVEILADYDVVHREQQPFFMPAFGVTDFDHDPRTVWIFRTGDHISRSCTVVHEFLHIHYYRRGENPPEEFIRSEEERICKGLFLPGGVAVGSQETSDTNGPQ